MEGKCISLLFIFDGFTKKRVEISILKAHPVCKRYLIGSCNVSAGEQAEKSDDTIIYELGEPFFAS